MIVEKYILVGILEEMDTVDNVMLINNSNNYNSNSLNINFELQLIKTPKNNNIIIDDKKFFTKQKAINHINEIQFQYNGVKYWTVMEIYEDILDILEIRKYKLNKILRQM